MSIACVRNSLATLILATVPAAVHAADGLTPAEVAAGWEVLFDGTHTDHWRGYRRAGFPEQGWSIDGDALRVHAGGGGGDLITKASYENFEMTFEFRVAEGANSGVMYRVTEAYGTPWQSGPEYQVLDDAAHGLDATNTQATGGLYALYESSDAKVLHPVGAYNTARIVLHDGVVKHYLNGVKLLEADLNGAEWAERVAASKFASYPGFGTNPCGHLCLQDHGNDVWYRNIRVRDLDARMPHEIDLFAGDRLDQWTAHLRDGAELADVFTFNGDVVECAGQPIGYMRTNATYDNFVLRLEWRFDPVTRTPGNSGVLVRMMGEDRVWPKSVEAQLHSGSAGDFWNIGEFTMTAAPERTNGRNTKRTHTNERPVGEWNRYEIIVDGGTVTLIVNDEVLNVATDVEEIAGFICLQSEGVPIHFRRARLAEIN